MKRLVWDHKTQEMKPAKIIAMRGRHGASDVADVRFLHDGSIMHNMALSLMEKIPGG